MNGVVKSALACALLFTAAASAQESVSAADRPSLSASRTMTVGATVKEIDHETRAVTLETPDGEELSFTASPEVRNLAQVEVGDLVLSQLHEEVSIEVFPNPEGLEPGSGEFLEAARAEAGEMPGGLVSDTFVLTAVVEEINLEQNTFKLRGPEGNVREFAARDPENLKRAEVGDLVVITVTQAVGILVERPPGETAGG
jgi:Cu/Ag efflux protein CusF